MTERTILAGNIASAVDKTREQWIKNLIDVSRRNNLLFHRAVKGTIDLTGAPPEVLNSLYAGKRVSLAELVTTDNPNVLNAQARELQRRAQINLEEKGLQTLFVACGMARWPTPDGGRPYEAAVVLLPVTLDARWRDLRSAYIERNGEPQINLALLHVLATAHNCVLDPDDLLGEANGEEETFDPALVLARLLDAAKRIDGFTLEPRAILSNFSFQKMAMVSDLREHGAMFATHDVLMALAGDMDARNRVMSKRADIDPQTLDKIPADNEFLVLDADSSQQRVIQAVLHLQSGVIQGPPGTGKSQTIVNLIAALVAGGYRVLFVAEKRAALDVVLNRLRRAGLGHLALDLHGAETSRATVMQNVARSMEVISHTAPPNTAAVHPAFEDRRARLNIHVAQLHTPRPPSMLSAYQMQGKLLRFPLSAMVKTRWRGAELDKLTAENVTKIKDTLQELAGIQQAISKGTALAWTQAHLDDGRAAQTAVDLVSRLAHRRLPALRASLDACAADTGLAVPRTLHDLEPFLAFLEKLELLLRDYAEQLFTQDLDALANALTPAKHAVSRIVAAIANGDYRKALSTLRSLRKSGPASPAQMLGEVTLAAELLRIWEQNTLDQSVPHLHSPVLEIRNQFQQLGDDLKAASPYLPELLQDYPTRPLTELEPLFRQLSDDDKTPYQVARAVEIEREIRLLGGGAYLDEARQLNADPRRWPEQFEYAWVASCLDRVRLEEPALASFVGSTHSRYVSEFDQLDRDRITLAVERVRRAHAERAIQAMNQFPAQEALIRRESEKRRRHLPLRKLMAQAPDVLLAICPCWMASPLSVSQLLGADRRYFDVVIFDEASQVPPEDAAPAIMRAANVVVAGDVHQLPPTRFFAAGEDDPAEEDEALASQGFESLLDLMSGFMGNWWLEWHYRSHNEALIAFSNHHIYHDRLITFPSPGGPPSLSHVPVKPEPSEIPERDDQLYSSPAEVRKVVELVLEHARKCPDQSLGVIALGIRHAYLIEDELQRALRDHPELDEFFSPNQPEPFFVKNLERVQGDERDAIILTTGYSKNRAGKLAYRFGPLLTEGGERRLNVAITRARDSLTLVSTFSHYDMDPNRSSAKGVQLLRLYLEYAASQGKTLENLRASTVTLNPFEADVYEGLTAKGIPLVPQWGASGYRIDFAAQHPKDPGRLVLAIECDGASYHSVPTARDRDRLRQQQLEALGWRFHRIWSTDWFLRRAEEIDRALAAYQAAVAYYDEVHAPKVVAPQPAVPEDPPDDDLPAPDPAPVPAAMPSRGRKPVVVRQNAIGKYQTSELVALVQWICSDKLLRTDEEIIDEMVKELGFKRRGTAIEEAIRQAIRAVPRSTAGPRGRG